MFELDSAPQMYFEVFFELLQCRESSLMVVGVSFQAFRPE